MKTRGIFITQLDRKRLVDLIEVVEASEAFNKRDLRNLKDLKRELRRAKIVAPEEIPSHVVTMNSKVSLRDVESSEEMTYTLVFPDRADIEAGRISILAPIGTAILGYGEGDTVEWPVPSGRRRITIQKILYQPEAAGDYHL